MRISKVIAIDPQTKEKQTFTFGTAAQGKPLVTTMGGHLSSYLDFCFKEESENVKDVEVIFTLDNEQFSLSRIHNADGTVRSVLKRMVDGHWQVVVRNQNAVPYVENIIRESMDGLLKVNYVNNIAVDNFHGDLAIFDQIRVLTEVKEEIMRSAEEARAMKDKAIRRVKEYASGSVAAPSTKELDAINDELGKISHQITVATAQLGDMKAKHGAGSVHGDIAQRLSEAQNQYKEHITRQEEIDQMRTQVTLHDDVLALQPKIKQLQELEQQRAEYEKKRYAITTELEWQEKELANINQQLEEKNRQFALTQDKRNRIDAINTELAYISQLYEENKRLNETLLDLNEQQQRLQSERVTYLNKLEAVEQSLNEVKESLDAFNIPAQSIGELLETVRVDVKIEEVTSQIEKLQSEIAVRDSQIAEKENNLVVQMKRFRSVAELDVAVTPIKAKDTILQVLDAKYSKLEAINASLQEKMRNLERALEDYQYRIMQLESSRSKLEAERGKALLRKQEEFKREVYLNSQKVYNDDASGVFAVTTNFQDAEIEALDQEIAQRTAERDQLVERAAMLQGSIKEIKRHIEINAAEMEALQIEKNNINNRYNEIVAQNSSEAVFNYLKALNNDNGTKYLLEVQQDAVRSEAELAELKRYNESSRNKLQALKTRLKYLKETQAQFDTSGTKGVDALISTNDKMKDSLSDIGERLTAGYEQYSAIFRQIESINSKLEDITAVIVETEKTIKVNETQIEQSTEKAKKFAGSDDLEKAVEDMKYEVGDVESERQMLLESKQNTEKEVFQKKLELEKAQWLYETKCAEYDELYQEVQFELKLKGLDVDKVSTMTFDEAEIERQRKEIAEYDAKKSALAEKIQNYYEILKDDDGATVTMDQINAKQEEIDKLTARQEELVERRREQMEMYVAASNAKMRVTAAAAEAKTFAALTQTLNHNDIVGLLVADKIKAILTVATQYFDALTETTHILVEVDGKLMVNMAGEKVAYDDLDENLKTAVYVSLILALPNTDATEGKWLVFEERINMNKKLLSGMLLNMDNISYVIKYVKDVAPAAMEE